MTTQQHPNRPEPSAAVNFIAGGIAGAFSRTATAPLDRLKLILQHQTHNHKTTIPEGLRSIYREGGLRGFFRGNGTNCVKIAPETAVKMSVFEYLKENYCQTKGHPTGVERFMCGSAAGIASQVFVYPFELVKTRLALAPAGTYKGIADCMMKTVQADGYRGLYKGSFVSMCGIIPYAGIDLSVYAFLRDTYRDVHGHQPSGMLVLGFGSLSGMLGQFVTYPLALVRTRLQVQGMAGSDHHEYNGMVDCFQKTVRNEGVKGLYRGLVPNLLKAVPAVALSYQMYEFLRFLV
eukprot:PhF_6_TR40923/c0_g1_i1/m.61903/K14684/SLC25A23S; solute carrier family 25 (mitochondrial phosphate transporter), member 23/24/25/41